MSGYTLILKQHITALKCLRAASSGAAMKISLRKHTPVPGFAKANPQPLIINY